ncbi:citrate synthase, mitochondrial [Tanacetum coccineum]
MEQIIEKEANICLVELVKRLLPHAGGLGFEPPSGSFPSKMKKKSEDRLKKIKSEYGKDQLGNITVDMVLGGLRGMTGLLWETSLLNPDEKIHFRGLSIPECQQVLPAAKPGGEPLPEGLLWLLLTVKVPTKEQVDALSAELRIRANILGTNIKKRTK